MTFRLFLLVLIPLLLLFQCQAFVQCDNDRACPDEYECNENGTRCCKNNTCEVRSSWSLLTPECRYQSGYCRPNDVCRKTSIYCIPNEIFACDNYLKLEKKVKCGNDGYFIKHGFEMCSEIHQTFFYSDPSWSLSQCAERCIQHKFSVYLFNRTENYNCNEINQQSLQNITSCYADCNACLRPEALPDIIKMFNSNGIPQWTINELARKCSQKLLEIQNQDQSLKSKARQFVDNVRKKTSLDVSDDFDWLLSTTTVQPTTQSPTTIESSTTTEPITTFQSTIQSTTESSTTTSSTQSPTTTSSTQSPTTTESSTTTPKMHTTYKISSFMNDNITVSYKMLILISLAVLTIFALTTLLIFRFANRQYLYRLEPENSYQMSTLVSNSRLSN